MSDINLTTDGDDPVTEMSELLSYFDIPDEQVSAVDVTIRTETPTAESQPSGGGSETPKEVGNPHTKQYVTLLALAAYCTSEERYPTATELSEWYLTPFDVPDTSRALTEIRNRGLGVVVAGRGGQSDPYRTGVTDAGVENVRNLLGEIVPEGAPGAPDAISEMVEIVSDADIYTANGRESDA